MKTWKKEEINFLKQNYKTLDYKNISEKLNRSIGSIYWKSFDLGLKKGRWTKENRLNKKKITRLLIEQNQKLNRSPSVRDVPISLKSACQRHFGNFNNAKRYAGLIIKEYCPKLKKGCYRESKELAYIVGSLIGDGSFRLQKSNVRTSYVIIFATKDKDFMDFFVHNFKRWSGYDPKIKKLKGGYKKFPNGRYYTFKEAYITQIPLKEACIFLKKFNDDPLYSSKFFSDKNIRWLIKGLWDAEGCIRLVDGKYLRIHFTNSNKKIIDLYSSILNKFGFNFSILKNNNCFHVNILNEYEMGRFIKLIDGITIKRKANNALLNKLQNNKQLKVSKNFSESVYELVRRIPQGKVSTYSEIAKALKTKAYRAVGTALKNNKKPIIIPCHRVINSNGKVGSYKGKKNSKEKIKLLKKEGIEIKNNKIDLKKYLFLLFLLLNLFL